MIVQPIDKAGWLDVLTRIGGAEHERAPSIDRPHHCIACEQEPGPGSGKARKHEPRYEREHHESDEHLNHGHRVAVQALRMHVPVADGRQGLYAEKECPREARRIQVRNAAGRQSVEAAKQEIKAEKQCCDGAKQPRPAHCHEMVVQVLKDRGRDSLRHDLSPANFDGQRQYAFTRPPSTSTVCPVI
jgi:hypothetical protein